MLQELYECKNNKVFRMKEQALVIYSIAKGALWSFGQRLPITMCHLATIHCPKHEWTLPLQKVLPFHICRHTCELTSIKSA